MNMLYQFFRYRLGKPSKRYAPWYEPVLKTARLAIAIITLLDDQSRASRLSFADVIKRVSQFDQKHHAFISSNPSAVERYVVVHGQIILQMFSEYPNEHIRKCAFGSALAVKMEERHHTKWIVKKKLQLKKEINLNPRAAMEPVVSKRKAMPATTTKFINSVWGEFYSNYLPEGTKEAGIDPKDEEEADSDSDENVEDDIEAEPDIIPVDTKSDRHAPAVKSESSHSLKKTKWDGKSVGELSSGKPLYRQAFVSGNLIATGKVVQVGNGEPEQLPLYYIEYMYEGRDGKRVVHGRLMQKGAQTVLANTADERELFLTNECVDFELEDVKDTVVVEIRSAPWGYQHRKENAQKDKVDRERAEERKAKGLSMEYYCKSLYWPERGAFFRLPIESMGLGNGVCNSCKIKEAEKSKEVFNINSSGNGFTFEGTEYHLHDFVYLSPELFDTEERDQETFKGGRNVGLKAYVVCQLLEILEPKASKQACPTSTKVKVQRFFRPEDVSPEKAYSSDIREV